MDKEKLMAVHAVINDVWGFEKKFYEIQDEASYWKELMAAVTELEATYKGQDVFNLMQDMLIACMADIERRARRKD